MNVARHFSGGKARHTLKVPQARLNAPCAVTSSVVPDGTSATSLTLSGQQTGGLLSSVLYETGRFASHKSLAWHSSPGGRNRKAQDGSPGKEAQQDFRRGGTAQIHCGLAGGRPRHARPALIN